MRILIAEDDPVCRRVLEAALLKWDYEVTATADGLAALEILQQPDAPPLAILDWTMPRLDGLEVCQRLRAAPPAHPLYLILLTARGERADLVAGLEGGADNYLIKPFDRDELRASLHVGRRMIDMQRALAERVQQLEEVLSRVKQLRGLIPICSYCKKVRDDGNYWQQVDAYVAAHTQARFSHGICPECVERVVKPELQTHGLSGASFAGLS